MTTQELPPQWFLDFEKRLEEAITKTSTKIGNVETSLNHVDNTVGTVETSLSKIEQSLGKLRLVWTKSTTHATLLPAFCAKTKMSVDAIGNNDKHNYWVFGWTWCFSGHFGFNQSPQQQYKHQKFNSWVTSFGVWQQDPF